MDKDEENFTEESQLRTLRWVLQAPQILQKHFWLNLEINALKMHSWSYAYQHVALKRQENRQLFHQIHIIFDAAWLWSLGGILGQPSCSTSRNSIIEAVFKVDIACHKVLTSFDQNQPLSDDLMFSRSSRSCCWPSRSVATTISSSWSWPRRTPLVDRASTDDLWCNI